MSQPYEEILGGSSTLRRAPGPRHELICSRLHDLVEASVATLTSTRKLSPRAALQITPSLKVCPDLSLITSANGRLWLAAEIVNPEDHKIDTVEKKQIYEDLKLPRLWMIDPRYDNIEVYHSSEYGLTLKGILSGCEFLSEKLLPNLKIVIAELFSAT
jgi:Uma2 family endonuclease